MFHHFPRFLLRLRTSEQDFAMRTVYYMYKCSKQYINHLESTDWNSASWKEMIAREILNGQSLIPKDSCPQAISSIVLLGHKKSWQKTYKNTSAKGIALWGAQQHFKGLAWTGVPLGLEKKRVPVICDFKGIDMLKHFKVIHVACQLFSLACSFCTQILRIHYHSSLHRSLHAFITVSVMMYHTIFPFESYCFVSGQDNTTLEPARKYENYHPWA